MLVGWRDDRGMREGWLAVCLAGSRWEEGAEDWQVSCLVGCLAKKGKSGLVCLRCWLTGQKSGLRENCQQHVLSNLQ